MAIFNGSWRIPNSSVNYNHNAVTRRKRSSDVSTNYIHNTVKTTKEISSNSANSNKYTVAETEWTPYGSVNYHQNTVTRGKRISDGSTQYNNYTVKITEMIPDGSTNSNKNTATDMERILYGSINYYQNTVTRRKRSSDGSTNCNNDTVNNTEMIPAGSTDNNNNTATEMERIPYGSVNYDQNTVTRRKRRSDGSTQYNNYTVKITEMIPGGSTDSNKNTATDMEMTHNGSVYVTKNTATQTEMISDGSAKQTQDEERYRPELFTTSVMTFNDGFSKGFNNIKKKISPKTKNLKINETLNILSGLSTQPTMNLITTQEPCRGLCHEYGTCSIAQNKTKWYCYCDSDCQMFNDCCYNYNGTIRNSNSQLSFDCYPQTYIIGIEAKTGFLAVDSCPDSYKNRTVKERCLQNNLTENGLFVSHGKTLTFKNKFCALCNNITDVKEFDIVFATVEGVYEYMPSLKRENRMAYFLINADYKVIPPRNTNLRFCMTNLISTSNNYRCQSHSNPIFVPELLKLYKNYFCLDSNIASDIYTILCIYEIVDFNFWKENSFSLSILISLGNPEGGYNDKNQCKEWTEEIQQQGVCSQFDVYTNICIDFIFSLFSNQVIEEESFHQIAEMVSFSYNAGNFTIRTSEFKIWIDDNGLVATVRVEMIIQKSAFRHEIEENRKYLTKRKVRVILKNDTYNPEIEILNSNYMPNNGTNMSFISQQHEYRYHYFRSESLDIFPSDNRVFGLNQIDNWRCGEVNIEVQFEGVELYVNKMSCLTISNLKTHTISVMITYVSFSVSAIALCVLIIVNRKLRLTISIPISNIENISVSIMLSNILFMFGIGATETKTLCYVIGVILHYLWLSVFSFMTISVACITSTLSKMTIRKLKTNESSRKRKRRLTALGLTTPLILVIPSICIDVLGPSFLSAGYGSYACFPNNYPANLIFFTGPVMVTVFLNASCLIFVIIQVCKIRTEAANIPKLNIYQDAKMYLRMVVLSGVFWFIGIFNALYDSEWLEYIFTLLCGLTGFFLAVANLTTNRFKLNKRTTYSSRETTDCEK
ncbi:Hypothetical predicted protein [Mytilus galloprovincialis]|uniref:G-protein coupled receptors family 2 profile 2 domain-containing protein n=1 Tax=Mytilus galloprovincialis TaxID=29158 RepID=A0A8B6FIJ6_MYTGA|nr:Hypothetical predicted protein [Mytilus galloprovincialis]